MKSASIDYEYEKSPGAVVRPPVAETLLTQPPAEDIWADLVVNYPLFSEQIVLRNEVITAVEEVLDVLSPTEEIEDALRTGHITVNQARRFYKALSEIMTDSDYERLVLYLPFEVLPRQEWLAVDDDLSRAIEDFKDTYLKAWTSQLGLHDVRANFVDGDVIEMEQRGEGPQRVVKAAHLIPVLINKGLLDEAEVQQLMADTPDILLKQSIGEALLALNQNEHQLLASKPVDFEYISSRLTAAAQEIEAGDYGDITPERTAWLKQVKLNQAVSQLSDELAAAIKNNLVPAELSGLILESNQSLLTSVLVDGIRKAVIETKQKDPTLSSKIYQESKDLLESVRQGDNPKLANLITKTYNHFYRLGIVGEDELRQKGIAIPVLSGHLSDNLKLVAGEMERAKNLADTIQTNPELAENLYPLLLVFGSRLKGYGDVQADMDMAVFVKPDVPYSQRHEIRQALNEHLGGTEKDHAVEFWLDDKDGRLAIHDFENFDPNCGESYWSHVLLGAAWVGSDAVVDELQSRILPSYFDETSKTVHGHNARQLWLEEIERDVLQYRLLQKGYERYYPPAGGMAAPSVDGKSMFWDSGYRQLATKLFIEKVFLPKLAK